MRIWKINRSVINLVTINSSCSAKLSLHDASGVFLGTKEAKCNTCSRGGQGGGGGSREIFRTSESRECFAHSLTQNESS